MKKILSFCLIASSLSFLTSCMNGDKTYNITWENDDHTILTKSTVKEGEMPKYDGPTPTKSETEQYVYSFSGWSPEVVAATCDKTYTATYTSTIQTYTVTWLNDDGTELEKDENVPYGSKPHYDGTTPTKHPTQEFTYTFSGWDKDISQDVIGDITFRAQFSHTTNTYTVIWKNDNGAELEKDENVPYGTIPSYDGETPTKQKTQQYTYTFSGWDKDITQGITGNVTFTAQFSHTTNTYTVIWLNDNGTELEKDENVPYGTVPSYGGSTPTKERTQQYTYDFSGWDGDITQGITGDTTFTAQYTSTVNKYTVIWKNDNGVELEKDENVAYGTIPSYDGETPTKQKTQQYTYTFSGWDKDITQGITDNVTFTAQFSSVTNTYTVIWKNDNGTILETDKDVPYGTIPSYGSSTPTKEKTQQYTYTFSGWDGDITQGITGDATFTAQYTSTVNKYTVIWKNDNGTILETDSDVEYGTVPSYGGSTPTKDPDAQYTYTFSKWDKDTTQGITGDTTFTAQYTSIVNKYTVTWKNDNGVVLETDEGVEYGTVPSYGGSTPTKQSTQQYTYTFSGWDGDITQGITGDTTFTAQYTSTVNKYTVIWKNDNGVELEKDENVEYGTVPSYSSATPTKQATQQYTYTFSGWDKDITQAITGDTTFIAQYTSAINKYTVIWKNDNGVELEKDESVEYGTVPSYDGATPTKQATQQYTYTFSGWDKDITQAITGDITFTAQYASTVNKYTVTWKNANGMVLETDSDVEYGTVPSYDGATPTQDPTQSGSKYIGYTFKGWDADVTLGITGDTTFTATYNTYDCYKIDFINENSEPQLLETTYTKANETPVYTGETPTKPFETERTKYDFKDWEDTGFNIGLKPATKNEEYHATFTPYTCYLIKFVNYDDTDIIEPFYIRGGETPSYDGPTPTREDSDREHYKFSKWDKEFASATADQTYKAVYDITYFYKITFQNYDGTVLQEEFIESGKTVTYHGATPVRDSDAQYTYTFKGWDKEIGVVTADAVYTATYSTVTNQYTITFKNYDGTTLQSGKVDYGATPTYTGATPTKPSDAMYTYTFSGWSPTISQVTGNATYIAQFTPAKIEYTITFINEGEEYSVQTLNYGEEVDIPDDPTKESTAQYVYEFVGWSPAVETIVTGNATYYAQYKQVLRKYTVVWKNGDETLETDEDVSYGTTPTYDGETPIRKVGDHNYKFLGWSPSITPVTGDVTYNAIFDENVYLNFVGTNVTINSKYSFVDYGDYGNTFTYIIKPDPNYSLPATIDVKVDGVATSSYTYNPATGEFTIIALGDISLTVEGVNL